MESAKDETFRRIGQGFCGTVWAASTESGFVIKREDGGPDRSLHKDYTMHQQILKDPSASRSRVCVPDCYEYLKDDDRTWDERISKFPKEFQIPCNILLTERIPPFSHHYQRVLSGIIGVTHQIIRTGSRLSHPPLFGTKTSSETLADLYWRAHVDANDVEFVLAPPRRDSADATVIKSHILGEHVVWILDFDCCKDMAFNKIGVEQAVTAFYKNDYFYPRPRHDNIKDQTLWNEFKNRFLEASEAIIDSKGPEARLPALWMKLVEQRNQI